MSRTVIVSHGGQNPFFFGRMLERRAAARPSRPGSKSFLYDIFKIDGRRNRKSLMLSLALVGFVFGISVPFSLLGLSRDDLVVFNAGLERGESIGQSLRQVPALTRSLMIFLALMGVNMVATCCIFGQRFRDMGLSGKWAFLVLMPYVNFGILAAAFIVPTWPGGNRYGPDPRYGNMTGRWS